jgi:hypothetical protein
MNNMNSIGNAQSMEERETFRAKASMYSIITITGIAIISIIGIASIVQLIQGMARTGTRIKGGSTGSSQGGAVIQSPK